VTKGPEVKIQTDQDFVVKINEQLTGLLMNNLFSIAANHNIKGGYIFEIIN